MVREFCESLQFQYNQRRYLRAGRGATRACVLASFEWITGTCSEPQQFFRFVRQRLRDLRPCRYPCRTHRVAGIEAITDGDVEVRRGKLAYSCELVQVAAQLVARAGGVFEQYRQLRICSSETVHGSPATCQGFRDVQQTLLERQILVIARMGDQVFGADEQCPLNLAGQSPRSTCGG